MEAFGEPAPGTTTTTTSKPITTTTSKPITTTTTSKPTTTSAGNGISTPTPTQPTIVSNCNAFYFVNSGERCADIASKNGISLSQFYSWNPSAGSDCSGLWANAYACVGIIGLTKPTTTTAGNGVATPTPTQPSIVSNCNSFYFVKSGEGCADIASRNGISLSQFYSWNPSAGSDCSGLWANAYACVGIIGFVKPTTTTKAGNGVTTPMPIQTGMTTSCKTFHFVAAGETCDTISRAAGISLANFYAWNPAAGNTCAGLWANTYCCIAVL